MATLPTNRTTGDTPADHVSDHNTVHSLWNVATTKGDLIVVTGAQAYTRLGVGSDGQVLTADAASSPGVKWAAPSGTSVGDFQYFLRTAGDLSLGNTGATTWTNLPTIGTSWDITFAAVAGNILEAGASLWVADVGAVNIAFDVHTIVSTTPTNSFAYGTTVGSSGFGVPGWFALSGAHRNQGGSVMYAVQAGDLSGGNVTLRLRYRADNTNTARTLRANTSEPLHFWAKNLGTPP